MPPFLAAILANLAAGAVLQPVIVAARRLPAATSARAEALARRQLPAATSARAEALARRQLAGSRPPAGPPLASSRGLAAGLAARARELRP